MYTPGDNRMHPRSTPPPPPPPGLVWQQPNVAALNRFTWNIWLWVVWGVPLVTTAIKYLAPGGTEKLFFMVFTPFVIVGAGCLGWLPRFILKKRGFRYSPSAVSAVFHVHWWAFAMSILAINGSVVTVDVTHVPSPLGQVLPFIARDASNAISGIGFLLVVVSYIVLILLASMTERQTQARTRSWVTLLTMLTTPVAMITLGLVVQALGN
ncbi:MAG: hypothetical protein HLX51_09660 [Micrococcaceae bacterium]|uniref:hypothetical protein n=1 Tax=Yaniella flava TaxID=287930 RepID=UPI00182B6DA7|nr:hypothetical protein [Micrococcaceae bacterium]